MFIIISLAKAITSNCDPNNNIVTVKSSGKYAGDNIEIIFRNIPIELTSNNGFKFLIFDESMAVYEFNTSDDELDVDRLLNFLDNEIINKYFVAGIKYDGMK